MLSVNPLYRSSNLNHGLERMEVKQFPFFSRYSGRERRNDHSSTNVVQGNYVRGSVFTNGIEASGRSSSAPTRAPIAGQTSVS